MNASFDITKVVNKEGKYTSIPDTKYNVKKTFGIDVEWDVPGFKDHSQNVPDVDPTYDFDPVTTMAILAGFAHNRRVMVRVITGRVNPHTSTGGRAPELALRAYQPSLPRIAYRPFR